MKLEIVGEQNQDVFGRRLAACLKAPLILYLIGDLGTGKTTLVRGALRGLGHQGSVRSPTYTLLEPYELGDLRLFHLDLYRLGDPEELEYLGLRDLLDEDSVLFVEWPERGSGVLPPADLEIRLDYTSGGRLLELVSRTLSGSALVTALSDPFEKQLE
jgi:tRNA threonylcarbamoyladenosine biosynthesis protein TsaE